MFPQTCGQDFGEAGGSLRTQVKTEGEPFALANRKLTYDDKTSIDKKFGLLGPSSL